jgi:hypothetical protein
MIVTALKNVNESDNGRGVWQTFVEEKSDFKLFTQAGRNERDFHGSISN